jgi:hypothetical protein
MDAIIELDQDLLVTRVNAAAEMTFACRAIDVVGRTFRTLVDDASHEKLRSLAWQLNDRPHGQR